MPRPWRGPEWLIGMGLKTGAGANPTTPPLNFPGYTPPTNTIGPAALSASVLNTQAQRSLRGVVPGFRIKKAFVQKNTWRKLYFMSKPISDRAGWMLGAAAALPACPPFPAFTDFEQKMLDSIAPYFGKEEVAFRKQIASAEVVDRINTVVGFYTRVKVDRTKCLPVALRGHDWGRVKLTGSDYGLDITLWDVDRDGYLETIEGCSADDNPFQGVDLVNLKFIGLEPH